MNPEQKLLTPVNVGAWLIREREARGLTIEEMVGRLPAPRDDVTAADWRAWEAGERCPGWHPLLIVSENIFSVDVSRVGGFRVLSYSANRLLVLLLDGVPKSRAGTELGLQVAQVRDCIASISKAAKASDDPRKWPAVRGALLNNLELADQCGAEVAAVRAKYAAQIQELDPDDPDRELKRRRAAARGL